MERVPFDEAITDKHLLADFFKTLSWPQATTLKAFYGQPLSEKKINPETGWSELDYWAILQGSCEYDDLGYVTKILPIPYAPKTYDQLWAVFGRRWGKTSQLQSFVIAYEAVLGGHEEFVGPKQECLIYLIAQRMDVAEANLPFVDAILNSSPLLQKQIKSSLNQSITLKNGISIVPSPPSLKAQRGMACPVVAMDEVAFWYKDADSANPDFEVERAVSWSQLQFPNYKRVGISTPWTKEGLLWKYHKAGTEGNKLPEDMRDEYKGILTAFGPTAVSENPLIKRDRLVKEKIKDLDGYMRESLCVFPDSVSGFLSRALIEIAVSKAGKVVERPPLTKEEIRATSKSGIAPSYVAAMDPAFRQDSFGFCICHKDPSRGIVVDMLRRWTPIKGLKLNPKEVLMEISHLIRPYGVHTLYTDQYQLESLQQIALDLGMYVEGVDFTSRSKSKIFGNLQQLINQQKMELLNPDHNDAAQHLVNELIQLERRLTHTGAIQIAAPEGKHDDMAAVLALASFKAMWMDGDLVQEATDATPILSLFERCQATIQQNNRLLEHGY